jgi:hypothetical protein
MEFRRQDSLVMPHDGAPMLASRLPRPAGQCSALPLRQQEKSSATAGPADILSRWEHRHPPTRAHGTATDLPALSCPHQQNHYHHHHHHRPPP